VWAFGICLWEMFSFGKLPYPGLSNANVAEKVLRGYRMESPLNCPSYIYEIMTHCWDAKPDNRPTFGQLLTRFSEIPIKVQPQQTTLVLYEEDTNMYNYK
jgi:hypothetical protein